jgi:hypothetical protein
MIIGGMETVLRAIEAQLNRLNNLPYSGEVTRIIEAYSALPNSITLARAGNLEERSILFFLRIENMLRHEVNNLIGNNSSFAEASADNAIENNIGLFGEGASENGSF